MICKICETENPSKSWFCLECGAALIVSKIKDEDRMVSAKEFKDRIYGLEMPKGVSSRQLNEFVKSEMEKWRSDPWYMPMIGAPMKINDTPKAMQFTPLPKSDVMIDDDGNCTHDKDFECGLKKNCNLPLGSEYKSLVNVEDRLKMLIPDVPNVNHIYGKPNELTKCICDPEKQKHVFTHRSDMPLQCVNCGWFNTSHPNSFGPSKAIMKETMEMRNHYPNNIDGFDDPCGVCGSDKCLEIHKPTIQEQYQEAFENIQRFRRNRLERWEEEQKRKAVQASVAKGLMPPPLYRPFPIFDIPEELIHLENRKTPKERPPQSTITGTDVRKGIKPRREPPKKIDPIKDHVIKKTKTPKKRRRDRPTKIQWI